MAEPVLPIQLELISSMSPAPLSRSWVSAPHPSLPILATCTSDKLVRIYSLTSFTQLSSISGHKRSIRTCAWKPNQENESTLATGSFDASVSIWKKDHEEPDPDAMDFTEAPLGGENQEEEEDEEWRYAFVLDGHDSEVKSVSWSSGGNYLATCSRDKSVWIWEEIDDDDYETIAVLQEHSGDVKSVSWHPEEVMLASGSYDDDIRLWKEDVDDWTCISVLQGHESTVWMVEWECTSIAKSLMATMDESPQRSAWIDRRQTSGPRLASCSDDMTIRLWRRKPKEKGTEQNKLSIIRTGSIDEDWIEETQLPKKHERAIYAISWSKESGRIVSTGGDGRIIIYEERWREESRHSNEKEYGATKSGTSELLHNGVEHVARSMTDEAAESLSATEWFVVAELDEAHDVFEVNHVTWGKRADRDKKYNDEEVIVSTGDDGNVKVWSLSS